MTPEELRDFTGETPPAGLAPSFQALWWLKKGGLETGPEWERAHEIAQEGEGRPVHDLIHGLIHWIEGDHGNADYWYRRSGETSGRAASKEAEWERIAAMEH
jgi:hypothetical protein